MRSETVTEAGPAASPELDHLLGEVAEVARLLWAKGWAERNAGNLSYDVTGLVSGRARGAGTAATPFGAVHPELAGRRLLVTAAGTRMRDLAREPAAGCGILEIDAKGGGAVVVWPAASERPFVPTSELPSHLAIHAALRRRGAAHRALVHTHPTELLALSHDPALQDEASLNRALRAMHPEAVVVIPAGLALVPYVMPGTEEQGAAAGRAMETHDVALWARHGAVAAGADFAEAFDLIDTAVQAARLLLLCRAAGFEPVGLSDAELAELRRAYGPPRG